MIFTNYLLLGLIAGVLGGLLGLGGGIVMIPGLVLLFGLSQHRAQGTVLAAMLPPVGILAALEYYRQGNVDLKIASWLAVGLLCGSLAGALFADYVPDQWLRRIYGGFLLIVALKMLTGK